MNKCIEILKRGKIYLKGGATRVSKHYALVKNLRNITNKKGIMIVMKKVVEVNNIALFEEKGIRKSWYDEKWYFSIIDIISALTGSNNPRRYWSDLKIKLLNEGYDIQLYENIVQLKILAIDGKNRLTDCADTETILRIIESIPSPKAEPFKRWLAMVGAERIEEINDPELLADRMKLYYQGKGYSDAWIEQRQRGIITRHNLTDEWNKRGVKEKREYAILTNEIYKHGFDMNAKEYKQYKNIHESKKLKRCNDQFRISFN